MNHKKIKIDDVIPQTLIFYLDIIQSIKEKIEENNKNRNLNI